MLFKNVSSCLVMVFVLVGCGSDGEIQLGEDSFSEDRSSNDNPNQSSPSTIQNLSVTINIPNFYNLDSDINDLAQPYQSNDSFDQAQLIGSPSETIGFLNRGLMPEGRFTDKSDQRDIYYLKLTKNQGIQLRAELSDPNNLFTDLDLYLYDKERKMVKASTTASSYEEVTPLSEGFYYVEVQIKSNQPANIHANYLLSVIDNPDLTPQNGRNLTVHALSSKIKTKPKLIQSEVIGQTNLKNERSYDHQNNWKVEPINNPERLSFTPLSHDAKRRLHNQQKHKLLDSVKQKQREGFEAEPIIEFSALNISNDPLGIYQWYLPNIKYQEAYSITQSLNLDDVTVAVIDTGIVMHPDMTDKIRNGFDFVSDANHSCDGNGIDPDPEDTQSANSAEANSSSHGTSVAGIIGAKQNNQLGLFGLAGNVTIMPIRAIGCDGKGTTDDLAQALRYAAGMPNASGIILDDPADIINLSLGSEGFLSSLHDLLIEIERLGIIVVAAAGNDNISIPFYPASYDSTFSVVATNVNNQKAYYSNYGNTVDLAAPGGEVNQSSNPIGGSDGIISLLALSNSGQLTSGYGYVEGTSIATPIVSAIFALMKGFWPDLNPGFLRQLLIEGSLTGHLHRNDTLGYGVINTEQSILSLIKSTQEKATLYSDRTTLYFNQVKQASTFTLKATPGEPPAIDGINPSSESIVVSDISTTTEGLGQYKVDINLSELPKSELIETIDIEASNDQIITLQLSIDNQPISSENNDVGRLFIYVFEKGKTETLLGVEMEKQGQTFIANLNDLPEAELEILIGNNLDGDGYICEPFEFCTSAKVSGNQLETTLQIKQRY